MLSITPKYTFQINRGSQFIEIKAYTVKAIPIKETNYDRAKANVEIISKKISFTSCKKPLHSLLIKGTLQLALKNFISH